MKPTRFIRLFDPSHPFSIGFFSSGRYPTTRPFHPSYRLLRLLRLQIWTRRPLLNGTRNSPICLLAIPSAFLSPFFCATAECLRTTPPNSLAAMGLVAGNIHDVE
ncbi:hypothetical protein BDV23DRAFT_163096 [Aspergillus alliaceus]|uniref:Uncharacterized protein n=1 Tax=Petromyces alliaceus TaxID=209559 RepID=A0A5N6FHZ8_PETAA|nr:uncharacterized protein BDW43DRAFT_289162 [Aspergillus alliaceus]KAB8229249.1 hypothetical protein BDW43DRAFT_289162 [Aspergillus alliaceus]KAE8386582.1 hypothetical protein BDV23DRAFT_163096 [Aspergillus alliaceus]